MAKGRGRGEALIESTGHRAPNPPAPELQGVRDMCGGATVLVCAISPNLSAYGSYGLMTPCLSPCEGVCRAHALRASRSESRWVGVTRCMDFFRDDLVGECWGMCRSTKEVNFYVCVNAER